MRRPFIAGNWKLNKTVAESLELVNTLNAELSDIEDADIVVAPVFTAIRKRAAPSPAKFPLPCSRTSAAGTLSSGIPSAGSFSVRRMPSSMPRSKHWSPKG
jgi:hypothetical protein